MLSLELSFLDVCSKSESIFVDNVSFQLTDANPATFLDNKCVVVFGFPSEISFDELDIYLEPCRNEICLINVLRELPSFHMVNGKKLLILENKPIVIISFSSTESATSFIEVYNNLQLPSYRYVDEEAQCYKEEYHVLPS